MEQTVGKSRKAYFAGLSAIAIVIAVVSAAATYSINMESFGDWSSNWQRVLAFLATMGIEAMFVLSLYGATRAVTGGIEKALSAITLGGLLMVMAINFVIHRQIVKGIPLSEWQVQYYEWIGAVTLFGVVGLIVMMKLVSYESKQLEMERNIAMAGLARGLQWKQAALQSPEMEDYLDSYRPAVFDTVRRQLQLPPGVNRLGGATAADTRVVGFTPTQGEAQPSRFTGQYIRPGESDPNA